MSAKNILAFGITLSATWSLLAIGRFLVPSISPQWSEISFLDYQLKYQALTAILATAVVVVLRLIRPKQWKSIHGIGFIGAPATKNSFFGIAEGESWKKIGWTFSVIITLVTALVVWLQVVQGHELSFEPTALLLIPLLAAINAAVEESITRFGVVVALIDTVTPTRIAIISGCVFGTVHYFGTPGGGIGVVVAGVLGWLLARSVLETRGMFWAWWIHFLQDIIILGALFAVR